VPAVQQVRLLAQRDPRASTTRAPDTLEFVTCAPWSWRSRGRSCSKNVPGLAFSREERGVRYPGGPHRRHKPPPRHGSTRFSRPLRPLTPCEYGVPQLRDGYSVIGHRRRGWSSRSPNPPTSSRRRRHLTGPAAPEPARAPRGQPAALRHGPGTPSGTSTTRPGRGPGNLAPRAASTPNCSPLSRVAANYLLPSRQDRRGTAAVRLAHALLVPLLLKLEKRPAVVWTLTAQPGPAIGPFHWTSRRLSAARSYGGAADGCPGWLRRCWQQRSRPIASDPGKRGCVGSWSKLLGLEIRRQFFGQRVRRRCRLLPERRDPIPATEHAGRGALPGRAAKEIRVYAPHGGTARAVGPAAKGVRAIGDAADDDVSGPARARLRGPSSFIRLNAPSGWARGRRAAWRASRAVGALPWACSFPEERVGAPLHRGEDAAGPPLRPASSIRSRRRGARTRQPTAWRAAHADPLSEDPRARADSSNPPPPNSPRSVLRASTFTSSFPLAGHPRRASWSGWTRSSTPTCPWGISIYYHDRTRWRWQRRPMAGHVERKRHGSRKRPGLAGMGWRRGGLPAAPAPRTYARFEAQASSLGLDPRPCACASQRFGQPRRGAHTPWRNAFSVDAGTDPRIFIQATSGF